MSKTAGIIIIGDEVLNGKVVDTNSSYLCKQFHALGIRVCKISTIPDQTDIIQSEVKLFSNSYDIVITTGGIGPTHDDVTYEGVASAFDVSVRRDEQMANIFSDYLKTNPDPAAEKLVKIPTSADVIMATNLEYPLVSGLHYYPVVKMRNVFCLPGVPKYMETIFPALALEYFHNSRTMYFSRTIYLTVDEIHVVTVLNELVQKFADSVAFGSYPLVTDSKMGSVKAKIIVESTSMAGSLEAEKVFISRIHPSWISYPDIQVPDLAFIQRLYTIETELSDPLKTSHQVRFSKYLIHCDCDVNSRSIHFSDHR